MTRQIGHLQPRGAPHEERSLLSPCKPPLASALKCWGSWKEGSKYRDRRGAKVKVRWAFLSLKFHGRSQLPDTGLAPRDVQLELKEGETTALGRDGAPRNKTQPCGSTALNSASCRPWGQTPALPAHLQGCGDAADPGTPPEQPPVTQAPCGGRMGDKP